MRVPAICWCCLITLAAACSGRPPAPHEQPPAEPPPARPKPSCTPTVPPKPGLSVPGDRAREHPAGVWYGTPELWTVLPATGEYKPRKSVWWSSRFGGPPSEEKPDVRVVARRLDAQRAPIESAGPGTNAFTETDGGFMIADFPAELPRGCWEVTATYKGASLRYVVEAP